MTQRRLIALFKFRFAVLQLLPVFIQGGLPCGKPRFNLADALLKLRHGSLCRGDVRLAGAGLLEIGEICVCLLQLGLQGGKLGFGLGLLGFKLRLARLVGRPAVVELLARCRKLGVAGGILGQGLQRGLALVVFGLALADLLQGVLELFLGVIQLGLVFGHLFFVGGKAVLIFLEAVIVFLPAVVELLPGVAKLIVAQRVFPERR